MSESSTEPAAGESVPAWAQTLQDQVKALAATVAGLVPTTHSQAQQRTESRLDRPSSIEDAVAREVGRLRRIEQEDAERATSAKTRGEHDARIKRLEQRETAPATPGGGGNGTAAGGAPDWRASLWR